MKWVLCGDGRVKFEALCSVLKLDETKLAKWFVQKAVEHGIPMPERDRWMVEVYEGRVELVETGLVGAVWERVATIRGRRSH